MACHFLRLSAEIRNIIYGFALVREDPIDLWPASENVDITAGPRASRSTGANAGPRYYSGDTMPVAAAILAMRQGLGVNLLRSCKTINNEATAVFYGGNDFRFTMEDGWLPLQNFLTTIGKQNRGHIKSLSVFVPVLATYYLLRSSMAATPLLGDVAALTDMDVPLEYETMRVPQAVKDCCTMWMEEKSLRELFLVMPAGLHLDKDAFPSGVLDEFKPLMEAKDELGLDISLVIHEDAKIGIDNDESKKALVEVEEGLGWYTLIKFKGDHKYLVAVFEQA
ncbi:MAG: hypothetical protein M1830_010397 [Pleopsidium flavum]|nr:MAG: hypothetical protein M1830_010397 [Pleopsidium flavum]